VLRKARLALYFVLLIVVAHAARAETVDWSTRPATNLRTGGTDAATFGAAPTLLTVTTSGTGVGTHNTNGATGVPSPALTITGTAPPASTAQMINSVINGTIDNESVSNTVTVTFTEPVYNVNVVAGDIDGGPNFTSGTAQFNDVVEFRAQAANSTTFTTLPTSGTVASTNVNWVAAIGRAESTGTTCNNTTSNACNVTVNFAGPVRAVTIRHIAAVHNATNDPSEQYVKIASITFTRSPQLNITKTSLGGTGTFPLARSNVLNTATSPWSATVNSQNIPTAVPGTAVAGTNRILFATNTPTTITESGVPAWYMNGPVACSDSNNLVSGNPASFNAPVSGYVATIDQFNIRPGAIITCAVSNLLASPSLSILKERTGGTGPVNRGDVVSYRFTVTNTGNVPINNVGVNDTTNGYNGPVVPGNEGNLVDAAPLGDSGDLTVNGTWDRLGAGDRITFTATYTVVQSDIDFLQ
jgi:hypothetical protein